jgi:O-antigen/teichoic acid export membrane protein
MSNRLIKNIFSAAGQTVVQTIILLVLYRYLIVLLGVEQIGIWSVVLATVSATRVSELGLGGSITKFVAFYRAKGNDLAASECLQTAALSVAVIFGIVIILGYPLIILLLPHVLPASGLNEGRTILPYGLISLWLTSIASIWMRGLDACLRTESRAVIMIIGSLIFFLLSMVSVAGYGLVGLALAQMVQGLFLVILGWIVLRKVIRSLPILPVQWKTLRFKEMLGYGINFQINSVVMLLFEPITKILLGRYGGLASAGYFEMAQRMVVKIRSLVVESNRVIVPVYAGLNTKEDISTKLYIQNIRHLLFLSIPVFAILAALTPVISELWVGSFEIQFVTMGGCITMAWFLNTISAPAYFAYLGLGKLRWVTVAHITMGCMNIFAGLFLGHILGWQGVIAAFLGSLVIGSYIPVFAYHSERNIKIAKLFTIHDVILIGVFFSGVLIALASYWMIINAELMSKWVRIGSVTVCIGIVSIAVTWFHPLRRELFAMAKTRLQYTKKIR